jgi:hypothetical protein
MNIYWECGGIAKIRKEGAISYLKVVYCYVLAGDTGRKDETI